MNLTHVLLVGSEPAFKTLATTLDHAYRFTSVQGLENALTALTAVGAGVTVLDLSSAPLPHGLSVVRRVREELPDVAVVLITDSQQNGAFVDALRLGVIDCLLKPVSALALADTLTRAMKWRGEALAPQPGLADAVLEMRARTARLRSIFAEAAIASTPALESLLLTLYRRDMQTYEHVRRVGRMSVSIGESMRLERPAIGDISRAALLHDIGKQTIPESIRRKPTPLSIDERALVRSHVQVACDVLTGNSFLARAAGVVLATRERFDGSGYPKGLCGASIPLGARIIAVAEAFDALRTGDGSDPAAIDAANGELVRLAGVRFDPVVIEAWLHHLDAGLGTGPAEGGGRRDVVTVDWGGTPAGARGTGRQRCS